MKKPLILALAVAGIGSAYTAFSWYFGKQTETNLGAQYEYLLQSSPYVEIVQRDYRRGVFASDETLTLELFGKIIKAAANGQDIQAPVPAEPLRLTIRTHIQHGPLPGGSKLAAAIAESELVLPEKVGQEVEKLLGSATPLYTQRSVINFDGSGHATFSSPKFQFTTPRDPAGNTGTLSWQGIEGSMDFSADMKHLLMTARAPEMNFSADDGTTIRLADLRLEGDQQSLFDDLPIFFSGAQHLSLGELAITPPRDKGGPVILKQVAYDTELPVNGDYIDLVARLSAENLQVEDKSFGPIHLDYSFRHLHTRALAELAQAFMGLYSDPALLAEDPDALATQFMPILNEHGSTLLNNSPEFHIDRISFANADGEANLAARVRMNALNLQDAAENPLMVLSKIEASGELSLQEEMILSLLRNPPAKEQLGIAELSQQEMEAQGQMLTAQFQQQVAMLSEQGYITREGGLIKTNVEYKAGQILVNGKPFMPMPMPMPMDEGMPMDENLSLDESMPMDEATPPAMVPDNR